MEVQSFAEGQWNKAITMLKSNPRLMSVYIFMVSLQHRPPLSVVQSMLSLNPKVANVQPDTMTALQTAIKYNCSVPVVTAIIKACPYALVTGDPLAMAKKLRPDEKELIQVLSRPLDCWIIKDTSSSDDDDSTEVVSSSSEASSTESSTIPDKGRPACTKSNTNRLVPTLPLPPMTFQSFFGLGTNDKPKSVSVLTESEREELNNIKTLCIGAIKGHKKLCKDFTELQDLVIKTFPMTTDLVAKERQSMLNIVDKKIHKQAQIQVIALDMKERAMMAETTKMQRDYNDAKREASLECQEKIRVISRRLDALEQRLKIPQFVKCDNSTCSPTVQTYLANISSPSESLVFATPLVERRGTTNDSDEDAVSLLSEESYLAKKNQISVKSLWCRPRKVVCE